MKYILGKLGLFISVGFTYYMLECFFRGYSHWSMFLLAGFLGIFVIDGVNNVLSFECDYLIQVLIVTTLCTIAEGCCGLIVNVWLGLNVWDYSNMPWGTFFFGQCNIIFCLVWMALVGLFGIFYCDGYDYYIMKIDPCPYYKIFGKVFLHFKERKDI